MFAPSARPSAAARGRATHRSRRAAAPRDPFASTGTALRRSASILATTTVALLLAGCPLQQPPAEVPFPDDPRVLNGAWQVFVTGLASPASDLVYAPTAGRLVAWFSGTPRTFEFDEGLGWREIAVGWAWPVSPGAYDPALEAFVAIELERADPRIRVTPIDGGPASIAAVALPAGHTPVSAARGSGRAFALTRDGAGGHHLTWWDAVSGVAGGTRPVGAVPDGMRASSNGRVLALWNLPGYRATLVDTAAPDLARTLPLGACRGNGLSEASADGRWFLLVDCLGNLRIADLAAESLASSAIGIQQRGRVAFALDGAEIVWLGEDGVVHALDAVSRERVELARLDDGDPFDLWYRRVVVHRATNLLAVVTGSGLVRTSGLPGAPAPRPAVELPPLDLSGAALDLTVAPIDAGGADTYEFHGTFTASGASATGAAWPLTGRVHAHGLHRYLPIEPTVAPAAPPPPTMHASASAVDPDSGAELYALDFATTDRRATSFVGTLHDVATNTYYRMRVERAGHGGP
jgi:hypothetical protein